MSGSRLLFVVIWTKIKLLLASANAIPGPSILPKHANSKSATSRNQRFCSCLCLDNDINEAISPLSSLTLDAGPFPRLTSL